MTPAFTARTIAVLLSAACALGPAAAQTSRDLADPELGSQSYILVEHRTGRVLADKRPDTRTEPASLTKVMTVYVAFRELAADRLALDDRVTVSEHAWRTGGSRTFLKVGSKVTVETLLRGVIIQSGNDASVALAERISGSEEAFAQKMNRVAQELGMDDTHYANSTGLPASKQHTTARDMATLARALIREFPKRYGWFSEREYTHNGITQYNRNSLLWRELGVDGIKTGHTEKAGYCLAASANRGSMRLVSVVMNADSADLRMAETRTLLEHGFRHYETHKLYAAGEPLEETRVWKGEETTVPLGLRDDLYITIPTGRYDQLEATMEIRPELIAPITPEDEIGAVRVSLNGEVLAEEALFPTRKVARGGFIRQVSDTVQLWWQ